MEKGLIFALFAAVSFAVNAVLVRKVASQTGESFTATAITVFIGIPFFAAWLSLSAEWSKLWSLSGQGFILLAAAGIIHFVIGRLLAYNSFRLIGANKGNAFLSTIPFYTVFCGVLFLNESITISLVFGVLCIAGGAALVTIERKSLSGEKQRGVSGTEFKGILTALGAALCWGITPVLIKPAVEEIGSPSVGAFVSYIAASIVMAFFFLRRQHRQQMVQPRFFAALISLVISGIVLSMGQLFNYTALGHSPASMVAPLISTNVLFVYLLSFLINRNIEVFTLKVILGMVVMVIGAFLIFY